MNLPHLSRFALLAALIGPALVSAAVPVPPAAPEIAAIGLMAQVEMCQQRQPAMSSQLSNALAAWSARNGNLVESARNFPNFGEAMADARKSLLQNNATFNRESCTALLQSLKE